MATESHRRAMRGGLPFVVVALMLLTPSIAIPACVGPWLGSSGAGNWIARGAWGAGALGSAVMLLGLLAFARAKVSGRSSASLMGAFAAWTVELAIRLYVGSSDATRGDALLLAQVCAATVAMLGLCGGMLALLRRSQAFRELGPWHLARAAFAMFLVALVGVRVTARSLAPDVGTWEWIEGLPLGAPLAWLVFFAPWIALVHAVRRSVRWIARKQSVAEILTG